MPSTPAKISIVTPVWNGLPYIKECVASVLSQDFQNWEFLIGDNASDDGTSEYLSTLSDPRIRIIFHSQNRGIFGNLNSLFREVSAPIAYILGADDYFLPGGLGRAVETWAGLPEEIAFVRFNFGKKVPGRKDWQPAMRYMEGIIRPELSDLLFFTFGCLGGNITNMSVNVAKLRDVGWCREDLRLAGDVELWSRMGRRYPYYICDVLTTFVRRHRATASMHMNTKGELIDEMRLLIPEILSRIEGCVPDWQIRLHGTLTNDTLKRDSGVRNFLVTGDALYLRKLNAVAREKIYTFAVPICWLLYVATLGGRIGRGISASLLMRNAESCIARSETAAERGLRREA